MTLSAEETEELRRIENGGSASRPSDRRGSRGELIRARRPISPLHAEIIRAYRRQRPTWSETTVYFVALRQLNRIRKIGAANVTPR